MNIEFMDGGFLFELNKISNNYGDDIIINKPEIIKKIYKDYIDCGCKYITSGNYGFKPLRQPNWHIMTTLLIEYLYSLKTKNDFIFLGSIPPYYESYKNGAITYHFKQYYLDLVSIMDKYVDKYLIETITDKYHMNMICDIISKNSIKPIFVSMYSVNNITINDIEELLNKYNQIEAVFINCCSFDDMEPYFNNVLSKISNIDIKIGFYCNKIDEKKYRDADDNTKITELSTYYIDGDNDLNKIIKFIKNYKCSNNLIIGGCCGYGVNEMTELINIITTINY